MFLFSPPGGHVTEYRTLESAQEVADAARAIADGTGPIAVDAERASGFRYSQRAYLIQVYRREAGVFLIDPIATPDLAPLAQALKGEEWVFHAASQDLACLREVGLDPERIFDTELGARLLGFERVGLGAVVKETLGIELEKAHSAADWSTRPLPQPWLEYAALDVELLIDVRDKLEAELVAQGKVDIASQEFAAVLRKEAKAPAAEPWRRLSGLSALKDPRRLAIARELWLARDEYAVEIDTAPGRIVPDSALLALAQTMPTSRSAMVATKGFNGRFARSQAERWWQAIEAGRHTSDVPKLRAASEAAFPPPRTWGQRNPEADARLKASREALVELASVMRLPVENLLTPDVLRRVAWQPEGETVEAISAQLASLGARPWQIDATAEAILESFVAARQSTSESAEAQS